MEDAAPSPEGGTDFRTWVETTMRERALARMIRASVYDGAMKDACLLPDVIDLQDQNPHRLLPIWEYLDVAASPERIKNGRLSIRRHRSLLVEVERLFGVDPEVIAAIWGLETGFGAARGELSVLSSHASLAYGGKRRSVHEEELIAALRIVQSGHVTARDMRGNWSGGMGHGNILPSTFLDFGRTLSGKGRVDVWSDDPADALATIAHFLAKHGWRRGQPWGYELTLPPDFDHAVTGTEQSFPTATWESCGLSTADGARIPDYGGASVLLPAGAGRVALMVLRNYHVLLRYNRSRNYAIAIGHLADRIGGGKPFRGSWPDDSHVPGPDDLREVQIHLNALGYATQELDGTEGPGTDRAVRAYQRARGLVPDGHVSNALLERLRGERAEGQA
ncbi:lytic murein transglycosylase [Maritimibacter sp. DP1N21-5]|uniref:lytic murein transglycosylase n=1 Tax=Maritimibacter sp. DP1N21-5 TaxID=2836867 RepID=UPI001C45576B|nr:lytic murein transglycosylase [Maritimibacter sp. DP1N21-5]MBV7408275.1 lytic murein transglycosylase [Maritimibacter sp. DP1N21-5]